MHLIHVLCLCLTLSLVHCDHEEDETDLSTATQELINAGLDYANVVQGWLEKNVGKEEIKMVKQNMAKFGQLALHFIDSTIQNLMKDDDDDEDYDHNDGDRHDDNKKYKDSQPEHSEL
ncbi:unnamed protein product [Schistosoma turkestanicum]|nr:unnamed protein product [Schistosoma turkestanicum]